MLSLRVECKGRSLLSNSYGALGRVVSRLCFSSERAISMCAYRAGTRKQKGHACRRQDGFFGWGNLHNSMEKLVQGSKERTYRSEGSRQSVRDRSFLCCQCCESCEERASVRRKVWAYFFFFTFRLVNCLERDFQVTCVFLRKLRVFLRGKLHQEANSTLKRMCLSSTAAYTESSGPLHFYLYQGFERFRESALL